MIYDEPIIKDMIILIPYFNFTNSIRIKKNLLYVIELLNRSKIPFLLGEVYFKTEFPHFPEYFNWGTDSYMFYKENIINLLETKADSNYKYVCVMDCDIYFENTNWYNKLREHLANYDVCQPFTKAVWYNKYGKEYKTSNNIILDRYKGHTGFVWAFKRDWLKKFKLFDLNLIGGGDRTLSNLILNENTTVKYIEDLFIIFKNKIDKISYSYLNMTVCHMYHGTFKNRQYDTRENIIINILKKNNLNNILDLIYISDIGLYEWKDEFREELNQEILKYFINRKDDK